MALLDPFREKNPLNLRRPACLELIKEGLRNALTQGRSRAGYRCRRQHRNLLRPRCPDPSLDPADFVRAVMDAVEAGGYKVPAGETSVQLKAGLSATIRAMYPQLAHSRP
jgi:hypothetical protein